MGAYLDRGSTLSIIVLLDPSNALTISSLGFITSPSMVNFARELLGIILKEELVSTKTLDSTVSTHSIEMCKALLWFLPSRGVPHHWIPRLNWWLYSWPSPRIGIPRSLVVREPLLENWPGHQSVPQSTWEETILRSLMEFGWVVQPLDNHFFMMRKNSSTSLFGRESYLYQAWLTCLPLSWVDKPLFSIGRGAGAKITSLLVTSPVPTMLIIGSSAFRGSSWIFAHECDWGVIHPWDCLCIVIREWCRNRYYHQSCRSYWEI